MAKVKRNSITGRSPSQGQTPPPPPWRRKPFSYWTPDESSKFASFSVFCRLAIHVKTRQINIQLRNSPWQKWGGHVHPSSSPRGDAQIRPCTVSHSFSVTSFQTNLEAATFPNLPTRLWLSRFFHFLWGRAIGQSPRPRPIDATVRFSASEVMALYKYAYYYYHYYYSIR